MPVLDSIQNTFFDSILNTKSAPDFISSTFPEERFSIYKNTVLTNLHTTLRNIFPGVWKLVGDECAKGLAYKFCSTQENFPQTGCLDDWGTGFPSFLAQQEHLSSLPYIKDYAQFELMQQEAYCAPSSSSINPSILTTIPEENIGAIKVEFIPAFFLLQSSYPLQDIHNVVTAQAAPAITLSARESYCLVARPQNEILTFWIDNKSLWDFITSLHNHMTLEEAYEKVAANNSQFDLVGALHFLLKEGLVQKIIG